MDDGDVMADATCRLCDHEVFADGLCDLHWLKRREMEKDWHMGVGH